MRELGPGVHHRDVLDDQRVRVDILGPDVVQDEDAAVGVQPEHHPPHPSAADVGSVVLSPDEAVLHDLVARGPETVTIGSPSEDLDPADEVVRVVGVVANGQVD